MESKREQALVGLFVLIATGLLVFVVFLLSGTMESGKVPYRAYFKNAGGLVPGGEVHYAGGPSVGHVKKVMPDPEDPTRMEIEFELDPDVPVKTDSAVTITSSSALGDNFLGIIPGTKSAPRAPKGSTLKAKDFTSLDDVKDMLAGLGPSANKLLDNMNDRVVALQITIDRVNDLLNDTNRGHIAGTMANLDDMLKENRPVIHSALNNVNDASAKMGPLIDNFQKASTQANDVLAHVDAMLAEDRPEIRQAVTNLRQALASANALTDQLNHTMDANAENLDEIIDNLRHVTDNLNSFTETIKTRPYTLIRSSGEKPHAPGQAAPQ